MLNTWTAVHFAVASCFNGVETCTAPPFFNLQKKTHSCYEPTRTPVPIAEDVLRAVYPVAELRRKGARLDGRRQASSCELTWGFNRRYYKTNTAPPSIALQDSDFSNRHGVSAIELLNGAAGAMEELHAELARAASSAAAADTAAPAGGRVADVARAMLAAARRNDRLSVALMSSAFFATVLALKGDPDALMVRGFFVFFLLIFLNTH
jgi:hypothetical protein